ncbi:MAG: hypothetical protein Tsb0034_25860 [Ekhidna sp.]
MEFEEYLKGKKIDPSKFKSGDTALYEEWKHLFSQIHPDSFTQQKLFLINKTRRKYLLEAQTEAKKPATAAKMRPKIKPLKPKTS